MIEDFKILCYSEYHELLSLALNHFFRTQKLHAVHGNISHVVTENKKYYWSGISVGWRGIEVHEHPEIKKFFEVAKELGLVIPDYKY